MRQTTAIALLLAAAAGLVVAACAAKETTDPRALRAAIEAGNRMFVEAASRGDGAGMAALYTETAQLFPPNSPTITGREAIAAFWQQALDQGFGRVRLEIDRVGGQGETAWEAGRYTLRGSEGQPIDEGRYIVVWKHEQEQLRIDLDIWNSALPVAGE